MALVVALGLVGCSSLASAPSPTAPPLTDWPHITSAIGKSAEVEAEVARILSGMTLAQKIGQMTQPEIGSVTPTQVKQYYIGSVLNGGGSWPNKNKLSTLGDWLALADAYYDASMATDMVVKVPVIWGTDAIHGHGNACRVVALQLRHRSPDRPNRGRAHRDAQGRADPLQIPGSPAARSSCGHGKAPCPTGLTCPGAALIASC